MSEPTDRPGPQRELFSAAVASADAYELGESPVWDEARERVLWVDIPAGEVLSGPLVDGVVEVAGRLRMDETVGAVVRGRQGQLLVAGARSLSVFDGDVVALPLAELVPADKPSRLNDGACDPAGRFLVGSMALDGRTGEECLYRVEADATVTVLDDDLTLSNGLGWSPDGTVMYSTDTAQRVVWSRPYDAASGRCGPREVALRFADGSPDGMCVDAAGCLWIAVWGTGEVRCFTPSGDRLATVAVPAPHVSSACFVGPGLDMLLITTAREDLSGAQLDRYPLSGRLFTARVEATGLPVTPWSGVRRAA